MKLYKIKKDFKHTPFTTSNFREFVEDNQNHTFIGLTYKESGYIVLISSNAEKANRCVWFAVSEKIACDRRVGILKEDCIEIPGNVKSMFMELCDY